MFPEEIRLENPRLDYPLPSDQLDLERLSERLLQQVPVAIAILELQSPEDPTSLRIVNLNDAARALLPPGGQDCVGELLHKVIPASGEFLEFLSDAATSQEWSPARVLDLPNVPGTFTLSLHPLGERCIGAIAFEITDYANQTAALSELAWKDPLTGLANRAKFDEQFEASCALAAQSADPQGALIMFDLNRFKEVNDSLGHATGDLLLAAISQRLKTALADCDLIARLGGDEFAVLITGDGAQARAEAGAEKILHLLTQPFQIETYQLVVNVSVGIALCPRDATDARGLKAHADEAMYAAKAQGGGIVRDCVASGTPLNSKLQLLSEFPSELERESFLVHYQPKLDLTTMKISGVEALVRWEHPERGLLHPAEFIELAEICGAIDQLTRTVTEQSLAQISSLGTQPDLSVTVNLSNRLIQDPDFPAWVAALLIETGFPPGLLKFELNERQLSYNPDQTRRALEALHDQGIGIGIDSFGIGLASLGFLHQLPIDELAMEMGFVSALGNGDDTLAKALINLGHDLGLRVSAKGVESTSTLETLRSLGCDSAQGFCISPPLPIEGLAQYLLG